MRYQRYFKLAGCPRCHDILKISFSMYGKAFACPQCGKSLKLVSKQEKNKIDVKPHIEPSETVQIKSLPEKPQKIGKNIWAAIFWPIRKVIDGIKYVLRIRPNKDS